MSQKVEELEVLQITLGIGGDEIAHFLEWVDFADNGVQALDWLGQHPLPAVILLDLMMPQMDGFEVLDALAAHPQWRDIPVIVLTAKQLTAAERERLLGQARRVIEKGGASRLDIVAAINEAVRRRPARTAVAANA